MWAVIAAGLASPFAFAAAWLVECAVLHAASRAIRAPGRRAARRGPPHDTRGALGGAPARARPSWVRRTATSGAADAEGRTYYRAYFTADFVWHMALTVGARTVRDAAAQPVHGASRAALLLDVLPRAGRRHRRRARPRCSNVEAALKVNADCTALLLLASIFLFAWTAGGGAAGGRAGRDPRGARVERRGLRGRLGPAGRRGRPLSALRDINVDAITAWWYNGLRIDGVHRTMFYTPQHGLSCALGLLGLLANACARRARRDGVRSSRRACSSASPRRSTRFSAPPSRVIYGLAVVADARGHAGASARRSCRTGSPRCRPPLAVVWGMVNAMGEGAGQALTVGWAGFARNAPLADAVAVARAGAAAGAGRIPARSSRCRRSRRRVAAVGLASGLFLLYFVVLSERSWVGFRAGQILLAMLTAAARARCSRACSQAVRACWPRGARHGDSRSSGAPTTVIDTQNAADIGNRRMAPGLSVDADASAPHSTKRSRWVRTNTRPEAVVQAEPMVRGRGALELHSHVRRAADVGRPPDLASARCRNTRSGRGRCRPSSRRPTWRRRMRRRDGWGSTTCGWTATSSRPTLA